MSVLSERSVPVGDAQCRLRICGEGPNALVLFPAVMDSGLAFGRLQWLLRRKLPAGVATVAVDPPGYGADASVPGFETWPAFCAALGEALGAIFPGDLVFAGNSSGAVAAMESALGNPRAQGLAWICWCDWQTHAARSHELLCPEDEAGIERLLSRAWHRPPSLPAASRASMLEAAARHRDHVASFDAVQHRVRLAEYQGPLLVIGGASDGLVAEDDARASAARPGGRFERIEGSGHYPHREQPAVLAQLLSDFTSQCLSTDPSGVQPPMETENAVRADH